MVGTFENVAPGVKYSVMDNETQWGVEKTT